MLTLLKRKLPSLTLPHVEQPPPRHLRRHPRRPPVQKEESDAGGGDNENENAEKNKKKEKEGEFVATADEGAKVEAGKTDIEPASVSSSTKTAVGAGVGHSIHRSSSYASSISSSSDEEDSSSDDESEYDDDADLEPVVQTSRYFLHYYLNGTRYYEMRNADPAANTKHMRDFFSTRANPTAVFPNPFFEHLLACLDSYLRRSHTLQIKRAKDVDSFRRVVSLFKTPNVITTEREVMGKWSPMLGNQIVADVRRLLRYMCEHSPDCSQFLDAHFPFHGPLSVLEPATCESACLFCKEAPGSVGLEEFGERVMCASCFQINSSIAPTDVADPVKRYYAVCSYRRNAELCDVPIRGNRNRAHAAFDRVGIAEMYDRLARAAAGGDGLPSSGTVVDDDWEEERLRDMGYRDGDLYPCPVFGAVTRGEPLTRFMTDTASCIRLVTYGDWYSGPSCSSARDFAPCPECGELDAVFFAYPCMHPVACAYCYCNGVLCWPGIPRCPQCSYTYCKAVYSHKYVVFCNGRPGNEVLRCVSVAALSAGREQRTGGKSKKWAPVKRTLLNVVPHTPTWGSNVPPAPKVKGEKKEREDASKEDSASSKRGSGVKRVWGWMRTIAMLRWLQAPHEYRYPLERRLRKVAAEGSTARATTHFPVHLGYLLPVRHDPWIPRLLDDGKTVRAYTRSGSRYIDMAVDKFVHILALLNAAYVKSAAVLCNTSLRDADSKMRPWIGNPLSASTPDESTLNTLAYYASFSVMGTLPAALCASLLSTHVHTEWCTLAGPSLFANAAVTGALYRRLLPRVRRAVLEENRFLGSQRSSVEKVGGNGDGGGDRWKDRRGSAAVTGKSGGGGETKIFSSTPPADVVEDDGSDDEESGIANGDPQEIAYDGDGPRISELRLRIRFGSDRDADRAFPNAVPSALSCSSPSSSYWTRERENFEEDEDDEELRENDPLLTYLEMALQHVPKYRCLKERPDGSFTVNGMLTYHHRGAAGGAEGTDYEGDESDSDSSSWRRRRKKKRKCGAGHATWTRKRIKKEWRSSQGREEIEGDKWERSSTAEDVPPHDKRRWSRTSHSDWMSLFLHFIFLSDEYVCREEGDTHVDVFSAGQMYLTGGVREMTAVGEALNRLFHCILQGKDERTHRSMLAYVFSADDRRYPETSMRSHLNRDDRVGERTRCLLDTIKICVALSGHYVVPQLRNDGQFSLPDRNACSEALNRALKWTVEKMRDDNTGGMYSRSSYVRGISDATADRGTCGDHDDDDGTLVAYRSVLSDPDKLNVVVRDVFASVVRVEDLPEELKHEIVDICSECNKVALLTILNTHHVKLVRN